MINKIRVRGFKKFADQEFEIPGHLVIAGANNSGKTSLLQAVAVWTEIALRWRLSNPDPARDEAGEYLATDITAASFGAIPLADFDHLWTDQKTERPLVVQLETDRWNIGFECLRKAKKLVAVRPVRDVREETLEFLNDARDDSAEKSQRLWTPVYIPPISGVEVKESLFANEETLWAYMARADAGKVLRNLLWWTRKNGRWDDLNKVIKEFFGYQLATFDADEAFLVTPYQHSPRDAVSYDLASAARGFLQILLIYAAVFGQRSAVYLLDEPEAHLHISLQNMLFRDLFKRAERDGFQMIVATHSERLIRESWGPGLRLLDADGDLRAVPDRNKDRALDSPAPDQVEVMEALRTLRLLYLESSTDLRLLIAWAETLGHRCLPFLQRTTPVETAPERLRKEKPEEHSPAAHFAAMRALVPEVRGVVLLDRDQRDGDRKMPESLELLFWRRREIESYLMHPVSVFRYLKPMVSSEDAGKARQHMRLNLSPEVFKSSRGEPFLLESLKSKDFFSGLFQEAGLPQATSEDFLRMAEGMKKEEIPLEVCEKLDRIADHLGIQEDGAGAA